MSNPKSYFGDRMQGTRAEHDSSLALAILNNDTTLEKEMADKEWEEFGVDWEFIKEYIAKNRHKYPEYSGK